MRPLALLLTALFALAPAALAQGVSFGHIWIVDAQGGPGVDATNVQTAVNLAASGDRILVRDGQYAGFLVKGKSLSIEAAPGAHVEVRGSIEVRDLQASQWSFLRNLHTATEVLPADQVATLHANSGVGQIWVEDCTFGAPPGDAWDPSPFAGDAATTSGARLILVRATLRGGSANAGLDGGAGLFLQSSNVWSHASTFLGGRGAAPSLGVAEDGTDGGAGIRVETGFLSIIGSNAIGGDGGSVVDPLCQSGGDGGAGIELGGLFPVYESHDLRLLGGRGGSTCGTPGADGLPLLVLGGSTVTEHPGTSVKVFAPSPVAQGDVQSLTVSGTPGDVVLLRYAFFHDLTELPGMIGWDLLLEPAYFLGRVVVPPSGTATVSREVPLLALPYESYTFHVQPIALQAGGQLVFGSPTAFGILPPGF